VPKIIKVNGNLTKFWRKQFWLFFNETRCTYCTNWNIHIPAVRTTIRLYTQTRNVMLVDAVRSDVHKCLWYNDWLLVFFRSMPIFVYFFVYFLWPGSGAPRELGGPGSLNRLNPR